MSPVLDHVACPFCGCVCDDIAVEVDGVPRKNAEDYIAKMDKSRSRYQQFFTKSRFGDPHEYDMCLNSAHLGYEACAEIILARLDG